MENFTFYNPTRLHFGRGQIAKLADDVPAQARVLLLAGGGSIRANGVYGQVIAALKGRRVTEFWGVEANPDFDTLMKAVDVCRREGIEWVLPVGGGSVLDGAKFVAVAVRHKTDPWDILTSTGGSIREPALPIGAVLTLPATGSEANGSSVVSRRSIREKLHFFHPSVYPVFSVLDPETTLSLPLTQVANGIADTFTHIMEQYLTHPVGAAVQDRFAESLLKVLIEEGVRSYQQPKDYALRSNLVWAATCALNGFIGVGVPQDWATHMIGHELTALHGIDHARTLAIVLPSLLELERANRREKLLQYAQRVWDIREGTDEARIDAAILATRHFYESIGIATRLSGYDVGETTADEVGRRLAARGLLKFGDRETITPQRAVEILRHAA
ncbi:iron-containing alcohol dehydrogenase [Nibricoccus sp. IMCC34717]|uniref:iron-containing alcohol dehydrogenase n=1 Tax=Nibricoccus sp. IMCC34717 TaxID=3034021 RepID=UPI00384C83FF